MSLLSALMTFSFLIFWMGTPVFLEMTVRLSPETMVYDLPDFFTGVGLGFVTTGAVLFVADFAVVGFLVAAVAGVLEPLVAIAPFLLVVFADAIGLVLVVVGAVDLVLLAVVEPEACFAVGAFSAVDAGAGVLVFVSAVLLDVAVDGLLDGLLVLAEVGDGCVSTTGV